MTPFSRLGGLAAESLDAIASALARPRRSSKTRIASPSPACSARARPCSRPPSCMHCCTPRTRRSRPFRSSPGASACATSSFQTFPGLPRFPYARAPRRASGRAAALARADGRAERGEGAAASGAGARLNRLLEPRTLHLDLIDYPGEWLLDLPLLSLDYEEWSVEMEELANAGTRAALSGSGRHRRKRSIPRRRRILLRWLVSAAPTWTI